MRGAPCLSPGPELPGPPPTLFCPGVHCVSPGPGGAAMAGAAAPRANANAAAPAAANLPTLPMPASLSVIIMMRGVNPRVTGSSSAAGHMSLNLGCLETVHRGTTRSIL